MTNQKKNQNQNDVFEIENLEKLAFRNVYETDSEATIGRFLRVWWSYYYKRPTKDPLLLTYTFEELVLEYFEQTYFGDGDKQKEMEVKWLIDGEVGLSDDEWYKKQEEEIKQKIAEREGKTKEELKDGLEFHDKF